MPKPNDDSLKETIKTTVAKIARFKDRGLGEQNTKASLIEPILESLGWDIRDPDEVHREFKPTSKDSPVDYALKLLRKPRLFVEAKGLGEDLADRKWIAQVLGYATVAGVEWCVLADGDEFRFYNATVPLDADEKLFCKLRLSPRTAQAAMRHSSIDLTMNVYTDPKLLDVHGALDALPTLPLDAGPQTEQIDAKATGTDDLPLRQLAPVLAPTRYKPGHSGAFPVTLACFDAVTEKRPGNAANPSESSKKASPAVFADKALKVGMARHG